MSNRIRVDLMVDPGPVEDAARLLVSRSTLADHVSVTRSSSGQVAFFSIEDDPIPFDLWGSGTQALWRLLSAMAYSDETVSLCEVASRLDRQNSAAVADAIAVLCGVGVRS